MLVHGSNLEQKLRSAAKYSDDESRQFLAEILAHYKEWESSNETLVGPGAQVEPDDEEVVRQRVELLVVYKDFIDQQKYAEKFDSRSNLHSTVLEEFLHYLFRDLVASFGESALIGKSHTFKDIFFAAPRYSEMVRRPYARIERKDHDFVIGTTVEASFRSRKSPSMGTEEEEVVVSEAAEEYDEPALLDDVESHLFDVPAVAIECKTYLDKSMLEGSSRAAEELKARNPNGLYLIVMEWIKLSEAVNLRKYKVDQIYVLRKQKNTDREFRFLPGYVKKPIDSEVVWHLFSTVRSHLTEDWLGGVEYGIDRGWLV